MAFYVDPWCIYIVHCTHTSFSLAIHGEGKRYFSDVRIGGGGALLARRDLASLQRRRVRGGVRLGRAHAGRRAGDRPAAHPGAIFCCQLLNRLVTH